MLRRSILIGVVFALLLGVGVMWSPQETKPMAYAKIRKDQVVQRASYFATLAPKEVKWVSAPVSGYVAKMLKSYGEMVHQGDPLMRLEGPNIQDSYVSSITGYLQAKDTLHRSHKKLKGEKKLLAMGAISERDYEEVRSAYEKSYLSWVKAKLKLSKQLERIQVDFATIDRLAFSDLEQIESMMTQTGRVHIVAPADGLFMPSMQGEKQKVVLEGNKVQEGDVLAMIIAKNQFMVRMNVPEQSVGKLKVGMPVTITGEGFQGHILSGKISLMQRYPMEGKGQEVAHFPVQIQVIDVPKAALSLLRLGMHVRVHVVLSQKQSLLVPIRAIFVQDRQHHVQVVRQGKPVNVPVSTGTVMGDDVAIRGPVQEGEEVVLHD